MSKSKFTQPVLEVSQALKSKNNQSTIHYYIYVSQKMFFLMGKTAGIGLNIRGLGCAKFAKEHLNETILDGLTEEIKLELSQDIEYLFKSNTVTGGI
jgi:hypothetical protein